MASSIPSTQQGELPRVREFLSADNLDAALAGIRALSASGPQTLLEEALLLTNEWEAVQRKGETGAVTALEFEQMRNRLLLCAFELVKDLERKAFSAGSLMPAPNAVAESTQVGLERNDGLSKLSDVAWLERGLESSRPVCRLITPDGIFGTGFLIAPRVLMTSNHVITSREVANSAKAEFNYQLPFGGADPSAESVRYDLDPSTFFQRDDDLNFALVAVRPSSDRTAPTLESWGVLRMSRNTTAVPGEHVSIVQHPNGGPKQIVFTASSILQVKPPHVNYLSDTQPGSSGSPVFNDRWEVIAIHHASGDVIKGASGSRYSGRGVLMSAIRRSLAAAWYEHEYVDRPSGSESHDIQRALPVEPQTKVLEKFEGFVDRIDDDTAYVTLKSEHGDRLHGTYSAAGLVERGIRERRRFTCTTLDRGDRVEVELAPIPDRHVSVDEQRVIADRIGKILEIDPLEGDY